MLVARIKAGRGRGNAPLLILLKDTSDLTSLPREWWQNIIDFTYLMAILGWCWREGKKYCFYISTANDNLSLSQSFSTCFANCSKKIPC